ncbi:hypothetical protein M5K25_002387 [Dendrobium thyrsiflorum]|uniref:DUF4283 domain-containing protein n=1 Tax=Dendrobium thyrsiflorum TaxID=117978 RepID=A0ABD0VUI2_DENTH
MVGGSSSTPWRNALIHAVVKNRGFFSTDADGQTSPSHSRSFKEVLSAGSTSSDILPTLSQGVFNGCRPNLDMIRNFFCNLKLSGFFFVGLLDSRHVAIQLSNDLDYSRVFARRSYFINFYQMHILKWTPFFDIQEESPIVPVWISFPNLRLHIFNPKVLHALGSVFGWPLQTDQAIASRTRPSLARVLVEVDITKKNAKEIWVGSKAFGYLQKVEFEKIPDFCSHCKMHGHALHECFKLHPNLKKTLAHVLNGRGNIECTNVDMPLDQSSLDTNIEGEKVNTPLDAEIENIENCEEG